MNTQAGGHIFKCGGLLINDENKEVTVDGELIKLTPIEYNILASRPECRKSILH